MTGHLIKLGFAFCLLLSSPESSAFSDEADAEDGEVADQEMLHSAKSNPITTLVLPGDALPPAEVAHDSGGTSQLTDLQERKRQSMDRLSRRAEQLLLVWKTKQAKEALAALQAQKNEQKIAAAATESAKAKVEESAVSQPAKVTVESPVPAQPLQPAPVPTLPELEERPSSERPTVTETVAAPDPEAFVPEEVLPTVPVSVDGPIDRLALASSLFGTASFGECLQTLDAIDHDSLSTEDQDWCRYVSACCHRNLGQLSEAESGYRELVGHSEVSWLADAARWWLDHLSDRQKLQSDSEKLSSNLQAWKKEIDGLRTAN